MKKIIALILALFMLSTCLIACNNTPAGPVDSDTDSDATDSTPADTGNAPAIPPVDPANATLFVGYAREDITPPEEMLPELKLTGYADGREILEIESRLYASCTAFRDAEGDIALIYTLDLHAMTPAQATSLASQITKETKVPKTNIILNVTHNHAAPSTGGIFFSDVITPAVVSAAKAAIADLLPCTELYAGEVNMQYYSFIRRYIEENGVPKKHMAEMDYMVPVAKFVRENAKDVILVNFAAHCDTVSGRAWNTLAADYVDTFRRVVEHETDAYFSMQLGATGDVNPSTRLSGEPSFYSSTSNYGKNLGYKIVEEVKKLPQLEIKGDVEAKSSTVRVEIDHSTDHLLAQAQEAYDLYYASEDKKPAEDLMKKYGFASIYECMYIRARANAGQYERRNISAVSIGNICFAAADFEMFATTGRTIKDGGNELYDLTFMCAYSNGMIGYIAADYAFDYDTYEVYSRFYVRGTAETIAEELVELIGKVAE